MNRDQERTRLQIISLCVLLAMALLFAGLIAISRQSTGVSFEESFLKLEQQDGKNVYSGKVKGEVVIVVCYEENGADVVEFSVGSRYHHVGRVEHPEGTILSEIGREIPHVRVFRNDVLLFSGGYDEELGMLCDDEGKLDLFSSVEVKAVYSYDYWYDYEFTAGDIFYFANEPASVARGSWELYALVAVISLLAAAEIAFPKTLFYFNHFLSVRDPEPSDFFWAMHNISCVTLPIIVLIGYIIALRMIV